MKHLSSGFSASSISATPFMSVSPHLISIQLKGPADSIIDTTASMPPSALWEDTVMSSGRIPRISLLCSGGLSVKGEMIRPLQLTSTGFRFLSHDGKKFMGGLPTKPATMMFAGLRYISRGVPHCCISPSDSTAILSDMLIASAWSWVT